MIARQRLLDLDEATAVMTLSQDIVDAQGGVLLPRGMILSDATLTSLRRRGIDTLSVVSEVLSAAELAIERARILQRFDRIFRRSRNVGASESLLQSVTQYRMGKLE